MSNARLGSHRSRRCYANSHLTASSSTSAWLLAPWSAAMKWWPITS